MVWIAIKAFFSGALEFLKNIPWQVWVVLGAALLLWRVIDYHNDTVEQARIEGDAAGYARAMEEVRIKAEQVRAKAEAARRKAEATSAKIVKEVQDVREEAHNAIDARADALRVQWDAQAAKNRAKRPAADLPGVPGPTSAGPAAPAVDAGMVAVPRGAAISFGKQHDRCQVDLKAWEVWYDRHKALSENWQPKPEM